MAQGPVPGSGRDEDPARRHADPGDPGRGGTGWLDDEEWDARQESLAWMVDPELVEDPDCGPPVLDSAQLDALLAGAREITAGSFSAGGPLEGSPGCTALMGFADEAAGTDDRYGGCDDDELVGAICAWDRVEAHAAARKHAAVAELARRRPEEGCDLQSDARMPLVWDEFVPAELGWALAESRWAAENILGLAYELQVKLPGTAAAFRSGRLRQGKVEIIARAAGLLDAAETRAVEALVLDRAAKLTPGGLRAAVAKAVMQVAPDKARKRREEAARDARVERWAEDSGRAALAGRELPPAEVLAADQRITWWAGQLKAAGLEGDMDVLRARAYLDILLGMDSRPSPAPGGPDGQQIPADAGPAGSGDLGPRETGPGDADPGRPDAGRDGRKDPGDAGPGTPGGSPPWAAGGPGGLPPGFVGRVNLTVPLTTTLGLADRPGEIPGIGPIDPALARDLATAAARNPRTTWCITVTDQHGHAIGHGCARPEPPSAAARRRKPGPPDGRDPPGGPASTGGPGFTFTACGGPGPPGGYGTWRLATGAAGQPDLIIALEPITTEPCDHRHEAKGHDPGVLLRHLTQVRYANCTAPGCRRPAARCDFEHDIPYEAGGRTCICNGDPKCRHDHRLKQHPRWHADRLPDGAIRWTTPAGRHYTTEPTRYPI
jgi:hypothetical protein